jgi:hypothetical protein
MSKSSGLGEQAHKHGAEIGLSSQLDAVENSDVNIKAELLNLVQGQVEVTSIRGEVW